MIGELSPVEVELLAAHLESLERALDPAFNRLNGLSLAIPEFISTFNKVGARRSSEGGVRHTPADGMSGQTSVVRIDDRQGFFGACRTAAALPVLVCGGGL